jgi:hypothetical protein
VAKKNLNNPSKPAVKVRSTKGPAEFGGRVSKLTDNKTGKVRVASGKTNVGSTSTSNLWGATKSSVMRDTKKAVKEGLPPSSYSEPTKKGSQLAANKSARAKKGK